MQPPETTHPQLASIGQRLEQSLRDAILDNDEVRSAFEELAFELQLARRMGDPTRVSGLGQTV